MDDEETLAWFLSRSRRKTPKKLATIELPDFTPRQGKRGNLYQHTRVGRRPDLDIVTRGRWEANILRILKAYNIAFEYEPYVYVFPVKRGNKGYLADILLATGDVIEVKGYLGQDSMVKLRRFKRYYPEEFANLTMIISKNAKKNRTFCEELEVPTVLFYETITRLFKDKISNWE